MPEQRITENAVLDALVLLAYDQVERNLAEPMGETPTDHYQSAAYHVVRALLEEVAETYERRGNMVANATILEVARGW